MCYTIAQSRKNQFHFDITYKGKAVAKDVAMNNVAYEAIKYMKDDLKWNPKTIEDTLNPKGGNGIGAFWEPKASNGEQTSGYTKELVFDKEGTYYVHTQRYKSTSKTFYILKYVLKELGFEVTSCN
jgi:signal recognition particle subunit SEC65